ncbi:MAG TPA: ABC transporter substrate-binding protein [Alphaproteobacteria bacterium]|nr:ABC transporter substrate-binding protein [Alphaproteobacteria bacterium]
MIRHLAFSAVCAAVLASASARAADKIDFMIDWVPTGEEAYPYVGVQEGFFAQEGLEVTIKVGRGSVDTITKVATGVADFGSAAVGALMGAAAQGPVPVKAIYSIYSKQPDAIFTTKGSGITAIKDLNGRTVGTATFSSSNTIWPVFATMNGLDLSKIKVQKVEVNTLAPLLATGQIDATINWVTAAPNTEAILKKAGKEIVVLPWSEHGLDGYGLSVIAADKVIKERPDVVARFVRAFTKVTAFVVANPAGAAKDLKAMVPEADLESDTAEARTLGPLIKNEVSERYGMGTYDPVLLKKTWEWVAKAQNYPLDKLDPETVVNRTFLPRS